MIFLLQLALLYVPPCLSFGDVVSADIDRRQAVSAAIGSVVPLLLVASCPSSAASSESTEESSSSFVYERRNRNKNNDALIREDYWYMTNKIPPRKLDLSQLPADDPTWNAWGECTKSEVTGNSCTYVSLKQKQPAYSKYFFSINLGAREYEELGWALQEAAKNGSDGAWEKAATLIDSGYGKDRLPSPSVDALLKMVLFATAMLTSPNFSGPSRELLITRFYVNEASFASKELQAAIQERDVARARAAWEFGKDSWNSYFAIVNRAIVPKVGDKFVDIQ